MKKVWHEIINVCIDYKNSFFTKRNFVLLVLLFFVTHIFFRPVKEFAMEVGYKVSVGSFVFLLFDLYYLLIFIFACIYFVSNVPFLNYHQMYRIVRLGKLKWGIYQISNIFISSILLLFVVFCMAAIICFPCNLWENDWGKIIYTLSLTNVGEEYGVVLHFSYQILKNYTPLQMAGLVFLVGTLCISFLGNMMFLLSLYFSRVVALSFASIEAALIIMSENMYLFPKLIFLTPFSWLRFNQIQYLLENNMPVPKISEILIYLGIGNLICIVLTLRKIKNVGYSKHIKKE